MNKSLIFLFLFIFLIGCSKSQETGMVTIDQNVQEGQIVVTSGLDGLPSSLLVGKISHVKTKSGELFKTVRIDSEFNNLFLENVFILKD